MDNKSQEDIEYTWLNFQQSMIHPGISLDFLMHLYIYNRQDRVFKQSVPLINSVLQVCMNRLPFLENRLNPWDMVSRRVSPQQNTHLFGKLPVVNWDHCMQTLEGICYTQQL